MQARNFIGVMLVITVLLLPVAAGAAMWVAGQGGAAFFANQNIKDFTRSGADAGETEIFQSAKFEPAAVGGLTIGYDFIKTGFLGYNWPEWMKYFSFAVDFTYNRWNSRQQFGTNVENGLAESSYQYRADGYMACLSFLFMAKYGFFCDSEVPFGRVQPYVGVGPGVMFTGMQFNGTLDQHTSEKGGSKSTTDIALVTEAGVRFMCLKNVSIDTAFRYVWCEPSFNIGNEGAENHNIKIKQDAFMALLRVGYHF
jgi:outer membrane protein W